MHDDCLVASPMSSGKSGADELHNISVRQSTAVNIFTTSLNEHYNGRLLYFAVGRHAQAQAL